MGKWPERDTAKSLFSSCAQIAELEAQCTEADQEKQKNAQLTVRVQELEAELQDKEQVRLRDHSGLETTVNRSLF